MSRESVWNATNGVGSGFYIKPKGTEEWIFQPWGKTLVRVAPKTREQAVALLTKWKKEIGSTYAMVQCGQCHAFHTGTSDWDGAICDDCPKGDEMKPYFDKKFQTAVAAQRLVGATWELDKGNTPFGSKQWGYQGTAKTPYVITQYHSRVDGSTTSDGWACSCMNFTRNVPRTPCKHILNIMLKEGKTPSGLRMIPGHDQGVSVKAAKVSSMLTDDDAAAFDQWKREQAEKKDIKPASGAELTLFGATGRKFR